MPNTHWTVALALAALLCGPASAQEKPTVAMIGTGTLGGTWGPRLAELGYPLVYGSREPERESVRELVARSGANAAAYFGFGRPYDIDDLAQFPRRAQAVTCEQWLQRLARYLPR